MFKVMIILCSESYLRNITEFEQKMSFQTNIFTNIHIHTLIIYRYIISFQY